MSGNQTIILADDLTGANDTAIQFVNRGLSALVLSHSGISNPEALDGYDVISINSNSREMDDGEAYRELRAIVKRMRSSGNGETGLFYKKIDSVLRGNPGAELSAVMDELGISLAVAAPSFPANQSILEHGRLSSGAGVIDAIEVFAEKMNIPVEGVPLDIIRGGEHSGIEYILSRHVRGTRVFVADAVTDTDLAMVYRIASSLGKPLILAGSAGLANHIARDRGGKASAGQGPKTSPFKRQGPVLVIAGTRQGETAAQITALSQSLSVPVINFRVDLWGKGKTEEAIQAALDEATTQMEKKPDACIVAVESMFKSGIPQGEVARNKDDSGAEGAAISAALGELTEKLLALYQFPVIISTGGDTSLGICKRLDITGIQPVAEICPGIPLGRIVGGPHEGRYLITKSGRFGNRDSFLEIMNYLS
jgi:uncharacterized protein YgbK (DUF1537 family)